MSRACPGSCAAQFRTSVIAEVTFAVAVVQPAVRFLCDLASVLVPVFLGPRLRMSQFPAAAMFLELPQLLLRNRIGETERDKASRSLLTPVRQFAVIDFDRESGCRPRNPGGRRCLLGFHNPFDHCLNHYEVEHGFAAAPAKRWSPSVGPRVESCSPICANSPQAPDAGVAQTGIFGSMSCRLPRTARR